MEIPYKEKSLIRGKFLYKGEIYLTRVKALNVKGESPESEEMLKRVKALNVKSSVPTPTVYMPKSIAVEIGLTQSSTLFIGIVRATLFRGPIMISLYVLS